MGSSKKRLPFHFFIRNNAAELNSVSDIAQLWNHHWNASAIIKKDGLESRITDLFKTYRDNTKNVYKNNDAKNLLTNIQ